jgi:translocation and assembly module TamA
MANKWPDYGTLIPGVMDLASRSTTIQYCLLTALLLLSSFVCADDLVLDIQGLKDERLVTNVEAYFGSKWVSSTSMNSQQRRADYLKAAETKVAKSLRPYGYYFPQIKSSLNKLDETTWELLLQIDPGQAVKVRNLTLEVNGDGREFEGIVEWQKNWPLKSGNQLDQILWTQQKEAVLDLAADQGYLTAVFEQSSIQLDLDNNVADLYLVLETGERAIMGTIEYQQEDIVKDRVLNALTRFDAGDFYRLDLVDRFRSDLWRTGYFEQIDVVEQRHLDQSPPLVDLKVVLKARKKDTHQGSIGFGTDSQFRMQYSWQRHLLSDRGDSLGVGLGWQQNNSELQLAGEYRLPRKTRTNQFWSLSGSLKTETEVLRVDSSNSDRDPPLLSGRVEDLSLRFGKVALRDIKWGRNPISETIYVEGLRENTNFREVADNPFPRDDGEIGVADDRFFESSGSLTLGLDLDWTEINGKRFNTSGHHERAWLFTSQKFWGSARDFSQAYFSSRQNYLLSDRWKLLVRGEVGYTDAKVFDYQQAIPGDVLSVSITELPSLYRFKTGGSQSVRGYGFDELSNNNIGSNNVLTASAEVEYQFLEDWSLAAFYDVGNAFNDWGNMDLKVGIGVGLRWYTLAGAIRLDLAQAQDLQGKPLQIHLTIGTPLL